MIGKKIVQGLNYGLWVLVIISSKLTESYARCTLCSLKFVSLRIFSVSADSNRLCPHPTGDRSLFPFPLLTFPSFSTIPRSGALIGGLKPK